MISWKRIKILRRLEVVLKFMAKSERAKPEKLPVDLSSFPYCFLF